MSTQSPTNYPTQSPNNAQPWVGDFNPFIALLVALGCMIITANFIGFYHIADSYHNKFTFLVGSTKDELEEALKEKDTKNKIEKLTIVRDKLKEIYSYESKHSTLASQTASSFITPLSAHEGISVIDQLAFKTVNGRLLMEAIKETLQDFKDIIKGFLGWFLNTCLSALINYYFPGNTYENISTFTSTWFIGLFFFVIYSITTSRFIRIVDSKLQKTGEDLTPYSSSDRIMLEKIKEMTKNS